MSNQANSSMFERPFIPLREFAGAYLDSHPDQTPDINAVLPALVAMGNSRELIEACFKAERARRAEQKETVDEVRRRIGAYEQAGEQAGEAAGGPVLPVDSDGLADGVKLAGGELFWNRRAEGIEVAIDGAPREPYEGLTRARLLDGIARHARMEVGFQRTAPWRIRSLMLERDLVTVVAGRNEIDGELDPTAQGGREWAIAELWRRGGGQPYTVADVLNGANARNPNQTAARVEWKYRKLVYRELRDLGWRYMRFEAVKGSGNWVKRWISPGAPLRCLTTLVRPRLTLALPSDRKKG